MQWGRTVDCAAESFCKKNVSRRSAVNRCRNQYKRARCNIINCYMLVSVCKFYEFVLIAATACFLFLHPAVSAGAAVIFSKQIYTSLLSHAIMNIHSNAR